MKHLFRCRLAAVAILWLWLAGAASAETLAEKVHEHTFANGLRLLVVERHTSPTFSAYIAIGVGAVDEDSSNRGVAHLLEHLMFKGTTTIGTRDYAREKPLLAAIAETGAELDALRRQPAADPVREKALAEKLAALQAQHRPLVVKDEFSRIYSEAGAVGYNAFTGNDLTTYVVSLPANKLELWASLESDRMRHAVLREFYTERDVVREERRRSYESDPGGLLYENLMATAFQVHPYRNPVIGWSSDLQHISLAATRSFHDRYYAPVNTVIALVGDIDTATAVALVGRYFGLIPPGTPVPPVAAAEPPQRGERRGHVQFPAEPRLAIAFHKPTLPNRADYVFDLIDELLSGGRTSRLYQTLVVKRELATAVSTYSAPGARYPNLFVIAAIPRHPHSAKEVEAAVEEQLHRLASEPVSDEELALARKSLRVRRLRQMQSNARLAGMLTEYQIVAGDWHYLTTYDQQIATVTPEDVMETARSYFSAANRTVVTLGRQPQE